jgi:hypothetical protein
MNLSEVCASVVFARHEAIIGCNWTVPGCNMCDFIVAMVGFGGYAHRSGESSGVPT